jgi:hypothetical protein
MKIKIFTFGTGETEIIEDVESIDIVSGDPCIVVNTNDNRFRLIDTTKKRVMVKVIE